MVIDGTTMRVLLEQTAAVDAAAELGDFAGRLESWEQVGADRMLRHVIGLA
jgi:hypothetical protein